MMRSSLIRRRILLLSEVGDFSAGPSVKVVVTVRLGGQTYAVRYNQNSDKKPVRINRSFDWNLSAPNTANYEDEPYEEEEGHKGKSRHGDHQKNTIRRNDSDSQHSRDHKTEHYHHREYEYEYEYEHHHLTDHHHESDHYNAYHEHEDEDED